MNNIDTRYYLILVRRLGKKDGGKYFILRDGAWEQDNNNEIIDRLMGYDPSRRLKRILKQHSLNVWIGAII